MWSIISNKEWEKGINIEKKYTFSIREMSDIHSVLSKIKNPIGTTNNGYTQHLGYQFCPTTLASSYFNKEDVDNPEMLCDGNKTLNNTRLLIFTHEYSISFHKGDDEWFYGTKYDKIQKFLRVYFKCDQLDGLIKFLKGYYKLD